MRLIDADARMQWLEDNTTEEEWMVSQYNADWVYSMLETAPTIDAVQVVRCDECVIHGSCLTEYTFRIARIENPFCCGGKKKDGDPV